MNTCEVTIAGERLLLLPQKAMYWPYARMLMVADIHFGKASSFRSLGVPVPHGTTAQNLSILSELIGIYDPAQILFLGDFLHAKTIAQSSLQAMTAWRLHYPALQLTLIRGNHDMHAGDPPEAMHLTVVDEPHRIGPFDFCHHPETDSHHYVIAGHIHPAYRVHGRHESLRLPCFVISAKRAVLPSFGAFTGGYAITRQPDESIFVVADDAVFAVNPSSLSSIFSSPYAPG